MMDIARAMLPRQRARILLVEDDAAVRRSLLLLLQANGYDVRAYASGIALLADSTSLDAACLVADYQMDETDGVDTLVQLRAKGWAGRAILITGHPSGALEDAAQSAGFDAIFEKPLRERALVSAVARLVQASDGD